jgi:multiple sugar transport system ATP-binding protein
MASVEIRGLRKTQGRQEVLKGVDLSCADGEFLVLIGPSGCGKSTLLNAVAGLDDPDGGEILIGGRDVLGTPPKDRDIAMVFQSYALYPTMTARENIGFGLEMRGVPKAERERKIAEAARVLRIELLLDRRPSQLSGGQCQRVAMGRALVRDPAVFLFDEPLSNLDAQLRVEMRTEIKRLHQRLKTTTIYVTHDQIEAMTLATSIAVMKDGLVQQNGDPKTIYDAPRNMFVAGFIGSPAMNFLPARLEAADGGLVARLDGPEGGARAGLRVGGAPAPDRVGRAVVLGVRPENIALERRGAPRSGFDALEAVVEVVEPTGSDTLLVLSAAGRELTARLGPDAALRPGQTARFYVAPEKTLLFDPATQERLDFSA